MSNYEEKEAQALAKLRRFEQIGCKFRRVELAR